MKNFTRGDERSRELERFGMFPVLKCIEPRERFYSFSVADASGEGFHFNLRGDDLLVAAIIGAAMEFISGIITHQD